MTEQELYHHGIIGMKWGVRRFQNKDGSLTSAGRKRYDVGDGLNSRIKIDTKGSGASASGGAGGGLDKEDEDKLEEDLKRMDGLVADRIEDLNFEYTPLIEDDDDVRVILAEDGIDPDKLTDAQFASAKRKLIEWDNKSKQKLREAELAYNKESKDILDARKKAEHDIKKKSGVKVSEKNGNRPAPRKKYVSGDGEVKKREKYGNTPVGIKHSQYAPTESELYHHGILGMKWGVRRYQNYDGSYTQKGLARYRDNENRYKAAKKELKGTLERLNNDLESLKKNGRENDKEAIVNRSRQYDLERSKAKRELKESKKKLKESYKHLKEDYRADKGKDLYKSGKTITDNGQKRDFMTSAIMLGGETATYYLAKKGNIKAAAVTEATTILGAAAVNKVFSSQNKKLRAYYSHSQWKG